MPTVWKGPPPLTRERARNNVRECDLMIDDSSGRCRLYVRREGAWVQAAPELDEAGTVPLAQLPDLGGGGPHTHPISDVVNLQAGLDAKCASNDSRLSDARTPTAHTQAISTIAGLQAGLDGKEAANANIQAHIASAHAPSTAQKNSDITKAEIEAKLAGEISTHTHAGGGGFAWHATVVLASDVSTGANVTPVTVTGLVFSFLANSTYIIEIFGRISAAAATTGVGLQFDVSAAVLHQSLRFVHQLANTGTLTGGSSIADDASAGVSSGIPANAGMYPVYASGVIVTGANAGTAQLRLRSEVAAVSTIKAGTVLRVQKAA